MIPFVFYLIIGMLIISGISMACVAFYARRFISRVPAATPYMLVMFFAAAWSVLYALDLLSTSLPVRIIFHNLRFLFLPFFSVLELWLVLAYVKKTEWIRKDWATILLIIPVTASILALTSSYHTLFRYNFSISTTGPVPVLRYSESAFYTFYSLYSFILLVLAVALLIMETRKKGTLREPQTILLILALALPTVINYTSTEGLTLVPGVNMAPVLFWIPAILYTVALFRYQFLDIVPIARSRLIEALSQPVIVLDPDGRIIDMNPAASSLFSLPYPTAVGKPVAGIAPDWPDFLSLCHEVSVQKRELVLNRNGDMHYYFGSGEPLLTGQGEIEGRLIFLQDITDLKNAEAALRQKTEELDQYFSTSLDLFCIADTGGYFRRLNPEWEKSLGYTIAELEGKRFLDFVHPDDLPATLAAVARLSSQKEVIDFTNRYRHRDGTFRWIEWRSFPKGDLIFAAARDITERRKFEEALRESEEKYRTIIENMQDMFFRTDLAGKITMISPSGAKIAGYSSPDELIGLDASNVYADPKDRDAFLEALRQNESLFGYPARMKTRDGTIRYTTISCHFYRDSHGSVQGIEGIIHDITDLRLAEESLRTANKKLNLLSGITRHDIRNQLTALKAYIQLSEDSVGNPEEISGYLEEAMKITDTIDRQIGFTRDYEDMGVNAPVWQDVSACIGKVKEELPLRNVRIEVETSGIEVFADPLLEKVFYNLIDNALRYGGDALSVIRVTHYMEGTVSVLVFEDNGAGITPEDRMQLFNRGFGKNTGLGLFLSREILSITGITITENSKPGKGARFEIKVPYGGFRFKKSSSGP